MIRTVVTATVAALDTELRLFEIGTNRRLDADVRTAVTTAYTTAPRCDERREAVYQESLRQQDELSPADLETFLRMRASRKQGAASRSVTTFEHLVDRYPNFYLGWFNLALALDDLGRPRDAEAAYRRAAELEAGLDPRDSSFHNSFGWFLYRQGRFRKAAERFERALSIDPEHPRARRNLQAARAAIGG